MRRWTEMNCVAQTIRELTGKATFLVVSDH